MSTALHVIMYHYVRDLPNSSFPRIKGSLTSVFRQQVAALESQYEMATLESALDFLRGTYAPVRDLCLLTFDDGLKEHYATVTPLLIDRRIQGLFFLITSCLQDHRVAPVHMNHFLMATLDFEAYRRMFLQRLNDLAPHLETSDEMYATVAGRTYRWDTPEVGSFKYLLNFVMDRTLRDQVLKELFEESLGDEESFCPLLYLNWEEAREMQGAGMVIGGHSHEHGPLASLPDEELVWDLSSCQSLLKQNLRPQSLWPFSYPYGKKTTFNNVIIQQLKKLGFNCSFSTEIGSNFPGVDSFALYRVDCKDTPGEQTTHNPHRQTMVGG